MSQDYTEAEARGLVLDKLMLYGRTLILWCRWFLEADLLVEVKSSEKEGICCQPNLSRSLGLVGRIER